MNRRVLVCCGSNFNDYSLLESSLNRILSEYSNDTIEIISGHAKGADSLGERYALEKSLKCTIFKAEWSKYGRAAGPIRNSHMLEYVKQENPIVVAYWDGKSHGTKDTITKAKKLNITCEVIIYEEKIYEKHI